MHTEIDVRSDTGQVKKNKNKSEVICYLNGGAGDEDEELTLDGVGVEVTAGVIG